jgi:hypothetical protein
MWAMHNKLVISMYREAYMKVIITQHTALGEEISMLIRRNQEKHKKEKHRSKNKKAILQY